MVFICEGSDRPSMIQPDTDPLVVYRAYLVRYLPFHATFHGVRNRGPFDREIDRALYMFGQTIGRQNWNHGG